MNQKKPVPEVYPVDFTTRQSIDTVLSCMKLDSQEISSMQDNFLYNTFFIKNLSENETTFLKKSALDVRGALIESIGLSGEKCLLLHGNRNQLENINVAMKGFSDQLNTVADCIIKTLNNTRKKHIIDSFRRQENLPVIMGVLNINSESFFAESRFNSLDTILKRAEEMISQGVDIIDLGGESTRPGAKPVSLHEEISRVIPAVKAIRQRFDIPLSVDTVKSEVARGSVDEGADMINDISFGNYDESMLETAVQKDVLYCGMHMKGTPETMQNNVKYSNVVSEVISFLKEHAELLKVNGMKPDKIIIDPGIGFGKHDKHNLALINNIPALKSLGYPVLIGISRKSMFGRLLNLGVEDRLPPSLSVGFYSAMKGADIIRVHDVKETRNALDMLQFLEI